MYYAIFNVPVLSFLFRSMKAIPIAGAKEAPQVLDQAYDDIAAALADGQLVCIFPEGQLTLDGEIGPFRPGLMRILERTPVPVIPMALSGLWRSIFSRNRDKWKVATLFPRVALNVGKPIDAPSPTAEALHALVRELAMADNPARMHS